MRPIFKLTPQAAEWKRFNELLETHSKRDSVVVTFAASMKDSGNRDAARRWIHGPNAAEKRESDTRWVAINSVTARDCAEHCIMDF